MVTHKEAKRVKNENFRTHGKRRKVNDTAKRKYKDYGNFTFKWIDLFKQYDAATHANKGKILEQHEVSRSTFGRRYKQWREYQEKQQNNDESKNNESQLPIPGTEDNRGKIQRLLTEEEEKILADIITEKLTTKGQTLVTDTVVIEEARLLLANKYYKIRKTRSLDNSNTNTEKTDEERFSVSWAYLFRKRHNFGKGKVHIEAPSKEITEELEKEIEEFRARLADIKKDFGEDMIMNMDETMMRCLNGDIIGWKLKGKENTVKVISKASEKTGISAALTITMSGRKLPPLFIKKGTTLRCTNELRKTLEKFKPTKAQDNIGDKMVVSHSEKGWMNTDVMKEYIKEVVYKYSAGRKCLVICDNYGSHKTEDVMKLANSLNIYLLYLPANTTSITQPLDVGVNGILKQKSRADEVKRLSTQQKESTTPNEAAEALAHVWINQITKEHIISAWVEATHCDRQSLEEAYIKHKKTDKQ